MTADPALAVEVVGLKRSFRSGRGVLRRGSSEIEALRGITFSIERGELFGLLGPNGAGKTTTIKVLTTLLLPSAGTARVLGFDVAKQPREVRDRIGYVFGGDRGLYDRLSALDNLLYVVRRQQDRLARLTEQRDRLPELPGPDRIEARDLVAGQTLAETGRLVPLELAVGLVYAGLGLLLLRLFELESRRTAFLETM